MPKMVRWEKIGIDDIPSYMRGAEAVYKDAESEFYLSLYDKTCGTAVENIWKVTDKNGDIIKGIYTCGGFKLSFPPIKWASKVADNKHESDNDFDMDSDNERIFTRPIIDENDDEEEVVANKKNTRKNNKRTNIINAIKEEAATMIRPTEEIPVKRGRGRPKGSKNRPNTGSPLTVKRGRGRPKGSKNKS